MKRKLIKWLAKKLGVFIIMYDGGYLTISNGFKNRINIKSVDFEVKDESKKV